MEVIKDIRTRKGANLNLKGGAEKILDKTVSPTNFAIRPDDFFGIATTQTKAKLQLQSFQNT